MGNKQIEDFYPQLVDAVFLNNCPTIIQFLWDTFKPLFPRRFLEKIKLVRLLRRRRDDDDDDDSTNSTKKTINNNHNYNNNDNDDIKMLMKYVSKNNIPIIYGGNNKLWPPSYSGNLFIVKK